MTRIQVLFWSCQTREASPMAPTKESLQIAHGQMQRDAVPCQGPKVRLPAPDSRKRVRTRDFSGDGKGRYVRGWNIAWSVTMTDPPARNKLENNYSGQCKWRRSPGDRFIADIRNDAAAASLCNNSVVSITEIDFINRECPGCEISRPEMQLPTVKMSLSGWLLAVSTGKSEKLTGPMKMAFEAAPYKAPISLSWSNMITKSTMANTMSISSTAPSNPLDRECFRWSDSASLDFAWMLHQKWDGNAFSGAPPAPDLNPRPCFDSRWIACVLAAEKPGIRLPVSSRWISRLIRLATLMFLHFFECIYTHFSRCTGFLDKRFELPVIIQ